MKEQTKTNSKYIQNVLYVKKTDRALGNNVAPAAKYIITHRKDREKIDIIRSTRQYHGKRLLT